MNELKKEVSLLEVSQDKKRSILEGARLAEIL